MTWKAEPMVHVRSLDGRAVGVAGEALELALLRSPHGVRQLVVRRGDRGHRRRRVQAGEPGRRRRGGCCGSAGRRLMPVSSTMSSTMRTAAWRSSSVRMAWRSSETSWSGIRALAQWTMPVPMPSMAKAVPMPSRAFCSRMVAIEESAPRSMAKYATRKISGANDGAAEQKGYLPFCSLCGLRVRVSQAQTMRRNSRILELLHLILTSRSYGARVVRTAVTMVAHNSPHPSLVPASAGLVFNSILLTRQQEFLQLRTLLGRPGGQPDREGDDDAQAGDPDKQAFRNRAQRAEVGSAG